MVDKIAKDILIDTITEVIVNFGQKIIKGIVSPIDRKATIRAITSIQKATIKTRNFITDNGYRRNEELSELWHDALNKAIEARLGDNIPDYLYQKAKFWGEPSEWLNEPETLRLVPKLSHLDETCEMLLMKIK
jgi:hypothetical protein